MVSIKYAPASLKNKPNLIKFPVTKVNLDEWNEIVHYYNNIYNEEMINRGFVFTTSGAISTSKEHLL